MKPMKKAPVLLVILDGFGYSNQTKYNAIAQANTPYFDSFLQNYPHTLLPAAGKSVGLPEGTTGNSQVGHLTIGTGQIVEQPSLFIAHAIDDGSFFKNQTLINNLKQLQKKNGRLHCMGLLSDANVHSNIKQLYAFLQMAKEIAIDQVFIHAFLDGRDVAPQSAKHYLSALDAHIKQLGIGTIGSLHGRFYAMDRDHNWQRTEQSYQILTHEQEIQFDSWQKALDYYYHDAITDEFVPPTQLHAQSTIANGDGIIFFNFRPDRARQLTQSFIDPQFSFFPTTHIPLTFFITPVDYHMPYPTTFLFSDPHITNTLNQQLAHAGKTIFSIAETEKYAHVTYFFNGFHEQPLPTETRILIPSLPLKNYIQHPEMSADAITQAVIKDLEQSTHDFYLINYANADMVGHSGNFQATIKAIECLDEQLGKLYEVAVQEMNGTLFITGDHGKAEQMADPKTGLINKAHTINPVYFIMVHKGIAQQQLPSSLKGLADIASYILQQMRI